MKVTKRHNLKELLEMGYQPQIGEKFSRGDGQQVTFEGFYRYHSDDEEEIGVRYKKEGSDMIHILKPVLHFNKEVTYEVIFVPSSL